MNIPFAVDEWKNPEGKTALDDLLAEEGIVAVAMIPDPKLEDEDLLLRFRNKDDVVSEAEWADRLRELISSSRATSPFKCPFYEGPLLRLAGETASFEATTSRMFMLVVLWREAGILAACYLLNGRPQDVDYYVSVQFTLDWLGAHRDRSTQ